VVTSSVSSAPDNRSTAAEQASTTGRNRVAMASAVPPTRKGAPGHTAAATITTAG
jgi:hypothetical protein